MAHKGPRILLYDLETAHNILASFDLFNDYIPHTNVLQERYIICFSYQWLGDKKVHAVSVLDDPKRFEKNPADDTYVVKKLHELISEADCVVAHNGDKFDKPYFEGRALVLGLPPTPPVTSIDTLKVAKNRFRLNSNRLDYIANVLGFGRKKETQPGLWLDALRGDRKAIRQMIDYNKHDVVLLRKVFERFIPYIPNYINRELFEGTGCPRCGSTHVQSRGVHRAISRVYQRFQCQKCYGWFRAVKNDKKVNPKFRIL